MGLQAESDEEFIVLSTSDYADSESTLRHPKNVEPFIKPFSFLPSLLRGSFKISGISEARTRKYSEPKPRRQAAEHTVNKYYNYHITGGFGGSGGEGGDQGGDGGTGHGPTVYFGHPEAREPSVFRTIPRGDVKLLKEVCLRTTSGVVGRQSRGVGVWRTVYHAEIRGDPGTVTVAMYQGDSAEEEWRKDIAKYESIWHPYIMQLCGLVNTKRLYAMVFHDELIPFPQFLGCFEHSPILRAYITAYCTTEFNEASDYIDHVSPKISKDLSVWIRSATGELCLDLAQGGPSMSSRFARWRPIDRLRVMIRLENLSLDAPDSEDAIISSLSEDQYHEICSQPSVAQFQQLQVSTEHPVGPGIFRLDSQHGTFVRITEPLQILPDEELDWSNHGNGPDELLPNSWIRYNFPRMFALKLELNLWFLSYEIQKAWLAQANHIFAEIQEPENVEDYVCVDYVQFILRIPYKPNIPEGYLFVCPPQDFCTNTEPHANSYQWPACPAYWSLDPSGAVRLSTEDARILGFPAIHIETIIVGLSWDRSIYGGLRRFHKGKGHNPESQEVARQLGYPLFEVLSDRVPFPARKYNYSWCDLQDPEHCREFGHYL
ncbi:MFS general substrate transporter [Mycena sanguinolenta]|uniref:MFS general substrate transporter n=1 Tax=Mycena sanguinolenta TaxID=230812 RepID=A0A8H6Y7I1_9AGAR|nr:MFS general substrate transporter [Mycena sanguinolenta]